MTTIIYAHPWSGSFNKAIKDTVINSLQSEGTSFHVIDLYRDNFNPVLTEKDLSNYSNGIASDSQVIQYQEVLKKSTELVFIFPIWWYHLPAILKGFIDKVFLKHFSWEQGKFGITGKLNHIKNAYVISTMDTPNWYYKLFMFAPLKHSFNKATLKAIGINNVKWISNGFVSSSSEESRKKFLSKISSSI